MTWPFENDTGAIVKRISSRNVSANRKRNIFVVLTIALASALLSAIVLYGFGVMQETQSRNQKQRRLCITLSMGLANFQRDRKKAISIAASLSLGGILLLIVSSVVLTRSPEQAARLFFPDGDYKIYLSSEQPEEEIMAAGNPLNDELRQEILSVDGVTDVLTTRQALHARFGTSASAEAGMCDALTDVNRPDVETALVSGAMPADAHSILLSTSYQKYHGEMDVGAAMELSLGRETVTVTISGLFDPLRVANGHGALAMDSVALFAPEELFQELHPEIENFDYSWSVVNDPKKAERVEAGLQEILSGHSNLGLDTIGVHIEYEKMQSGLIFGGLRALSWLIFLFGVVNLINTTLSNQMSRKRENSILRSVGLTGKQLCRMNICEGLCYAAFAALAVLLIGLPIAVVVCREVSRQSFAGEIVPYQFPILEMGLFLLVLFGLEFLLQKKWGKRDPKYRPVSALRETLRCPCGGCLKRWFSSVHRPDTLYLRCVQCGGEVIIPDADLLAEVERQAAEYTPPAESGYTPSEDTVRLTNAINRGLEKPERPEDVVALILQGISARYACFETPAASPDTQRLIREKAYAQALKYITITADNAVAVAFK